MARNNMQRSLNVYGGITFVHGKQVRGVVACTRAELPSIVGGKAAKAYVKNYWSKTGNKVEIETARSSPGVLFYYENISGLLIPLERDA